MAEQITELSIDLETYSDIDLKKSGVYKYAESSDFEILLFGYSVNGNPVKVIDIASGERIPKEILAALTDKAVIKWAHNSSFERICISSWLRKNHPEHFKGYGTEDDTIINFLDPASWKCTMVWGAYMGLPLSLKGVGAVLKLNEQKISEGEDLIRYFCKPCKPTKSNGNRTRNLPKHAPDKWNLFKEYNKRDVEVELAIKAKLKNFPVPDFIWDEYHIDQKINDRGIGIDMRLVKNAILADSITKNSLISQMQNITGLENPNSVSQMKEWLLKNGVEAESLDKKSVKELLIEAEHDVADVLSCRQQLAKSSVSKYKAMENAVCSDERARGMFQFYGANRTGRFSGRLIQLQNLPQNHMEDLEEARNIVRGGNFQALELIYDNVPQVLSELIRTAFIPRPGYKFIVCDFSSIEARVLSFLAEEQWRIDLFDKGGDIYCQSASQMFGVPVVKNGENGHLRQKGKIAELACIAVGSLVLTDVGLVPIEEVTTDMKVWDGEEWVKHEGIIYKGEREVITYEGLTATPDHLVWVKGKNKPVHFGTAAASGAHLVKTGNCGNAVRLGENHFIRETLEQKSKPLLCSYAVHRLRENRLDFVKFINKWKIKRLPSMLSEETNSNMVRQKTYCSKAKMRKPKRSQLPQLRRKRNQIQFCKRNGSWIVPNKRIWYSGKKHGNRPDRYKRGLRTGKYTFCKTFRKLFQSTQMCSISICPRILALLPDCGSSKIITRSKPGQDYPRCRKSCIRKKKKLEDNKRTVRLYDIRNAGKHHRFTVSNCLVHNCGYGGSTGALKAMGALEMGLHEEELQPLVNSWRSANPKIVQFWWNIDHAVKDAVRNRKSSTVGMFRIYYQSGMLFIDLPSGRRLSYAKPRMGVNQFGSESVTYEGLSTGKWSRIESYGPKFVENIVQAVSRDILTYSMKTLSHYFICGHVHDELIIECTTEVSVDSICILMSQTPPWIKGLNLNADGYECTFYQKK